MRVSVSLYAIHLHATPFTVGVLMALYALLPMLSAVSMGRLIDRFGSLSAHAHRIGRDRTRRAGPLRLWPTLTALHFTSVLIGSGFMMYQVAAEHHRLHRRPEDRPMTFSLAALGFSISGFVGPMLAGFGIDAFGHIATFGIFARISAAADRRAGTEQAALPQPHTHSAAAPTRPPRRRSAASTACCAMFSSRAASWPRRGTCSLSRFDLRLAHRIVGVGIRPRSRLVSVATFVIRGTSACDISAADRVAATDGVPLNGSGVLFPVSAARHAGFLMAVASAGRGSGCRSRWSCP